MSQQFDRWKSSPPPPPSPYPPPPPLSPSISLIFSLSVLVSFPSFLFLTFCPSLYLSQLVSVSKLLYFSSLSVTLSSPPTPSPHPSVAEPQSHRVHCSCVTVHLTRCDCNTDRIDYTYLSVNSISEIAQPACPLCVNL